MAKGPKTLEQTAISEVITFIQKWKKPRKDNMTKSEMKCIQELRKMEDITITMADMGGIIVVHIQKVEEKFDDKNLYDKTKDPTKKIKKQLADLVENLEKSNRITKHAKYDITSIEDLPQIRAQPETHKSGNPVRLITCSKNTILSPLSNWALMFMKPLRTTIKNNVNSTKQFVDEISKRNIEDEHLASLDGTDLYTNVSKTRAIDIAINRIGQSEMFCESNLTKTDLKRALLFILNNNYVLRHCPHRFSDS